MNAPCDLDATKARRLIACGELSPAELLGSCLNRIEETNGTVNAITAMDIPRAQKEAEAAEKTVRDGADLPPLHGIPIGKRLTQPGGNLVQST